jgi:hypothetical protein
MIRLVVMLSNASHIQYSRLAPWDPSRSALDVLSPAELRVMIRLTSERKPNAEDGGRQPSSKMPFFLHMLSYG